MYQLALRFDVDSVRCWEEGVPNLLGLAHQFGAQVTFFVNMGVSFNWSYQLRHWLRRSESPAPRPQNDRCALPTLKKLGLRGALHTMLLNPRLGDRYRSTIDAARDHGHELGLHGGADHVIWQRALPTLTDAELRALFIPTFEQFVERYGQPAGFASPGFVWDDRVLRLLDELGFAYASDLPGTSPFRVERASGSSYQHYQVPVTVSGAANVPIIESLLCKGVPDSELVTTVVDMIRAQGSAVLYGHPYVEGVRIDLLRAVLDHLSSDYTFVTMNDYLSAWQSGDHG